MRLMIRSIALVALAATLSACGATTLPIVGEPAPVPEDPVSFENVVVADDRQSVRVEFIGGQEFDPDNPCSVAYEGTAKVVGDELEIGIYAQQHPMPLPPDTGCDAGGYSRALTIRLDEPFTGSVVRDLAGQVLLLEPPAGSVEIGSLPDDWELRREGNVLGSSTPRWQRVWSPDPDPWRAEGDSMLTLLQAFGGPVNAVEGDQSSIEINGQAATFHPPGPTGDIAVVWSLGGDELALVGNLADFSEAEFIAFAESVVRPSQVPLRRQR